MFIWKRQIDWKSFFNYTITHEFLIRLVVFNLYYRSKKRTICKAKFFFQYKNLDLLHQFNYLIIIRFDKYYKIIIFLLLRRWKRWRRRRLTSSMITDKKNIIKKTVLSNNFLCRLISRLFALCCCCCCCCSFFSCTVRVSNSIFLWLDQCENTTDSNNNNKEIQLLFVLHQLNMSNSEDSQRR